MLGCIQFKNRHRVAHFLVCVKQLVSESIQLSLPQVIVGALRILQIVVRVNRSLDSRIVDGLVKFLGAGLPRQNVRLIREDVLDSGAYFQSFTVSFVRQYDDCKSVGEPSPDKCSESRLTSLVPQVLRSLRALLLRQGLVARLSLVADVTVSIWEMLSPAHGANYAHRERRIV